MPFNFITKIHNKKANKFKPKFDKYLISVEQEDSNKLFPGTDLNNTSGVGIYHFSNNKTSDKIIIKYLDKDEQEIDSLSSISNYNDYEKKIVEYLGSKEPQTILNNVGEWGNQLSRKFSKEEVVIKTSNKLKKYLEENSNSYGLIVSATNGQLNAKCLTSKNGQIYSDYEDFLNMLLENKSARGYNILMFDSEEAAKNCKEALKRPLLRFTILREQTDKDMRTRVYKYVPLIDWKSVNTDEDILIQCGCPEDKAREYVEYCTEVIEKVDNKK